MYVLRVLDFGSRPALRSQAIYHGIAEAMRPDVPMTLTLVSPAQAYVCIGLHQNLAQEVDVDYCRRHGLPVIRRHVGGGAVYLDQNQLFFHFIYPPGRGPARVEQIYATFIEPVLRTYRRFGIPARLRPLNDIHVHDRKIGGTGAASIGIARLMVGSFMFDFDAETMSRCLRVPSEKFRDKLQANMREYITTIKRELGSRAPTAEQVKAAFVEEIGSLFGLRAVAGDMEAAEREAIAAWERRLSDAEWTWRQGREFQPDRIKISAATHLGEAAHKAAAGLLRARLLAHEGRIAELELSGDFTCIPEDGVMRLAAALRGASLEPDGLRARLTSALGSLRLDMPGVTTQDWLQVLLAAARQPA